MNSALEFPLSVDSSGRTARAGKDRHIRDLIELVLMTEPGERVMHPDFGCGLRALVFAPMDDVLTAAMESLVQGQLRRWLEDTVSIDRVRAESSNDGRLIVKVEYHVPGEERPQTHVVPVTS